MTIQGTLVEAPRHPMFSPVGPAATNAAALNTLARVLTPFDGALHAGYVTDYGRIIHQAVTGRLSGEPLMLVGIVVAERIKNVGNIQRRLNIPANHRGYVNQPERIRLRQQIKVLTRISEQLATALVTREVQR